jgi:tetratricopeptide (TPR) repeat protein
VFCSNCGSGISSGGKFCSSCGKDLSSQSSVSKPENEQRYKERNSSYKLWLIPGVSFILVAGLLLGYFFYEQQITSSAKEAFITGEKYAKKGDYKKAEKEFQHSLIQRPHFPEARLNLRLVTLAQDIDKQFQTLSKELKNNEYEGALNRLTKIEERLKPYKGKIADQLRDELKQERTITLVAQLKFDMKGKDSITDLEPILTRAEALNVPEAKTIANEIKNQIVEVTYNKASGYLKEKHFSDALQTVESGLKFNGKSEKLLTLQTSIKQQQKDFERAEQQRIEQAMAAAAQEDEHNKTNAVNVLDVSVQLDEYGDAIITGSFENIATVPISSVELSYSLYTSDGTFYDSGFVYAMEYSLQPGEVGTFETYVYGVYEDLNVEIDKTSWYLN